MFDLFGVRRSRAPGDSARDAAPSRRATGAGVVVIALTAAVEAVLAFRYGTAPAWASMFSICWIVVWGICGLVAWRHRPVSRIGPLMVLMAALIAMSALRAFEFPPDFPLPGLITAVGFFGFNSQLALSSQIFLTYPSGRPTDPFIRRFVVAGWVLAIVGGIGRLAVYHTYVIDCGDRCGLNMLGFWIALPVAEFLSSTTDICFAVLGFILLVMLVRRLRGATARERRTLWLPLGSAAGAVLLVAVAFAGNAVHEDFAPPAVLFAATLLAVTAVPVAFLWGLLKDRLAFAGVGDLVGELGRVGPDQIQPKLARVLADPGLMVLFPVDGGLVDVDGNRVDAPLPDASRTVTRLGDGRPRWRCWCTTGRSSNIGNCWMRQAPRPGSRWRMPGCRPRFGPSWPRFGRPGPGWSMSPTPSAAGWNAICTMVLNNGCSAWG